MFLASPTSPGWKILANNIIMPNKNVILRRHQHFVLSTCLCRGQWLYFWFSADSQPLEQIVVIISKQMKTISRCPPSLWFGTVLSGFLTSTYGATPLCFQLLVPCVFLLLPLRLLRITTARTQATRLK